MATASFGLSLLCLVAASALASRDYGSAGGVLSVSVTVDPSHPISEGAPPDFASFSVEVPCAHGMIVVGSGQPRESYINLMHNLKLTGLSTTVGPNLRIGGNSADETYFASSGSCASPLPPGDKICITPQEVSTYRHASSWLGTVVVDLNLRDTANISDAVEYAKTASAALKGTDVLEAFEIGNEPDHFVYNKYRPTSYDYDDYVEEFKHELAALQGSGYEGKFVQGAVFCCKTWDSDLDGYVKSFESSLKTLSLHHYPLEAPSATIEKLMADKASDMDAYAPYAKLAAEHGVRFVIGEGNTASGGGRYGVSNTLASALWSIDMMFNALRAGITRFNYHGCDGGAYTPIAINDGVHAYARPLYYGMWFFSSAVRSRARMVEVKVDHDGGDRNLGGYRVYATQIGREVRVVVLGKGANLANITDAPKLIIDVNIPGVKKGDVGQVQRLQASNPMRLDVTEGLSYGGQTFDGSTNGLPLGPKSNETVVVEKDGSVKLTVLPATAVVASFHLAKKE